MKALDQKEKIENLIFELEPSISKIFRNGQILRIIHVISRDIKIEMDLQLVERENYRGILGKNYLDFR